MNFTYEQIRKYFTDELGIPLSSGSLFNFISASYAKPEEKQALALIKCNLVKENKCTRMKPASILIEKGYIMYHGLSYKRMDK
ncbi:hypothetical protein AWH60_07695 [Pseudoalteromonas haloplanktis]|nr:hypothetical protein AWH60_07695 [Pseudoalteromonas haloplanktis]